MEDTTNSLLKQFQNDSWKDYLKAFHLPTFSTDLPYVTCNDAAPHYFKFFGDTTASLLGKNDPPLTNTNSPCFSNTTITANWTSNDTITVNFNSYGKTALLCMDHYIISTLLNFDIKTTIFEGTSSITYQLMNQTDIELVQHRGLKVMRMCDEWYRAVPDLIETLWLFTSSVITTNNIVMDAIDGLVSTSNLQVQSDMLPMTFKSRSPKFGGLTADYLKQYVKSGDVFSCFDTNGASTLIALGTGGPVIHSAMAMWENDTLWVVEASTTLIRLSLESFLNQYMNIVWSPLSAESRAKFDVNKAWAWFENGIEGLPYGTETQLYSWMDTPDQNYPLVVGDNYWIFLFSEIEKIDASVSKVLLADGINNRLGTQGLTFAELVSEAAKRDLGLGQVMAMPELDSYKYDGGIKYICSALVAAILQAGGLFGDLEINPHEFTPRDVFQLKIFEENFESVLPKECLGNDPGLPYCQVRGKTLIEHDWPNREYNSILPYSGMNEHCAGMSPDYVRPQGC